MAAPTPLFFTVKVYEKIVETLNPAGTDVTGNDTDWVEITTDSKAVNWKHPIKYVVQVFKANPPGTTPQTDNDGVNIDGSANGEFKTWVNEKSSKFSVDGWKTYNDNRFEIIVKAKVKTTTVNPKFKVQTLPNSVLNTSPNYYRVPIQTGKKIPVINFTEAQKDPNKPTEVKADETENGQGYTQYNACKKEWVIVQYQMKYSGNNFTGYDVYLIKRDINGTQISKQLLGFEKVETYGKTPASDIGRKALLEAYQCQQITEDGDGPETPPVSIQQYPEVDRLNPPSHYHTRDISVIKKLTFALNDSDKTKKGVQFGSKEASEQLRTQRLLEDSAATGRLGMIFQDKDTAISLNQYNDDKKPWGFRFTYNPTNISYSTGADMSVDWMLSSKDPANYIGGNTTVSFKLYLNRIADMTELSALYTNPQPYSKNYPRTLTAESVAGILNRGTEYDLEYLYRVVNGSPRPSVDGLLTYTVAGKPAITSDFGYITGTPVWIRFHDNLRYKGSIATVGVEHLIFTENMVPMFSVIDISFIRYPITGETDPKVLAQYSQKIAEAAKAGVQNPTTGDTQ